MVALIFLIIVTLMCKERLLWGQAFLYLSYSKESEAILELAKTVAQQVINNSLRHRLQAARSMSDIGADTTTTTAGDTSVANQSSARTAASITTTSSAGESVSQKLLHCLCVSQSYTRCILCYTGQV